MSPPWSRSGDSATGLPVSVHPRGWELVCARTCREAWRRASASPRLPPPSLTCPLTLSQDTLSEICAGSWARGSFLVGLSQEDRGCSRGCWLGAKSGPEVPAWGAGGDQRPSTCMSGHQARARLEAGGPSFTWGSPGFEQWGCRGRRRGAGGLGPPLTHCPHPSAGGQVGAEGACGVTGVTPTGAAARVLLSQSCPPSCP